MSYPLTTWSWRDYEGPVIDNANLWTHEEAVRFGRDSWWVGLVLGTIFGTWVLFALRVLFT